MRRPNRLKGQKIVSSPRYVFFVHYPTSNHKVALVYTVRIKCILLAKRFGFSFPVLYTINNIRAPPAAANDNSGHLPIKGEASLPGSSFCTASVWL